MCVYVKHCLQQATTTMIVLLIRAHDNTNQDCYISDIYCTLEGCIVFAAVSSFRGDGDDAYLQTRKWTSDIVRNHRGALLAPFYPFVLSISKIRYFCPSDSEFTRFHF